MAKLAGWEPDMFDNQKLIDLKDVEAYNYVEKGNLLTVQYKGGTIVDYHPVNPESWADQCAKQSLIRAIQKFTRNPSIVGIRRNRGN